MMIWGLRVVVYDELGVGSCGMLPFGGWELWYVKSFSLGVVVCDDLGVESCGT